MNAQDAEEFTQSLGQIVAGSWRQIALAKRLGVPKALNLSVEDWVNQRLGGYVRLSISDRREAVAELTAEGQTTREIGEVLGVNHATVVRDVGANAPDPATYDHEDKEIKPDNGANAPDDPATHETQEEVKPRQNGASKEPIAFDTSIDPIQEDCADCETPVEFWQRSLENMAGDALSMRPYWTRQFGSWEKFKVPSTTLTLAKQAAKEWTQLARDLAKQKE